jgi:hypothetical protein
MKLFISRFLPAITFSSARAWASVTAGGSCMPALRRMAGGTTASIRAARLATPMAAHIRDSSTASGPMWRAWNSVASSRMESGVGMVVRA